MASALDQVNVRRLTEHIKRDLGTTFSALKAEDLVPTREEVKKLVGDYIKTIETKGIDAFKVVCDETNNTPETIAQGKLVVNVTMPYDSRMVDRLLEDGFIIVERDGEYHIERPT